MLKFLRGLPVCHAQGGTEKGCAHRAETRFQACTFVHFTRSPFTQRSRRRVLGKAYQISQEPRTRLQNGRLSLPSARASATSCGGAWIFVVLNTALVCLWKVPCLP